MKTKIQNRLQAKPDLKAVDFKYKTAILRALDILKSPTRPYAGLYNEPANGHTLLSVCLFGTSSKVHTELENLRPSSDKRGIYIFLLPLHTPLLVSSYL